MNYKFLVATDLGDAWFQAVHEVMINGNTNYVDSGSGEGAHRREMGLTIKIEHPGSTPLYPIMPEGSNIPPPTDEEKINEYLSYLMTSERQPDEHYSYGEDLDWLREWVIGHYKKYGLGNNHGFMTVGRPESVFFYDRDVDYKEHIKVVDRKTSKIILEREISNEWNKNKEIKTSSQCLRGVDTWIENNKLNFSIMFRSWDLWGGFPTNLGGLQLLKQYMADGIGVKDGEMMVHCPKIHIYENTWTVALMRLRKDEKILENR